jgi:predicted amidohydrolase
MSRRLAGPRPVVVGTCTLAPFEKPSNRVRLAEGLALVDQMAARARSLGWGLDLVVLPEHWAQGERRGPKEEAEPLDGPLVRTMAARARKFRTYVALSMLLKEGRRYFNAVVLLDRRGRHVGTYRKVFPVLCLDGSLECGITPGREFPVFDLDFGRVGCQVCFDVGFGEGWDSLGRQGAEMVIFPSATSGVAGLKSHAWRNEYYVVASTFRAPTVIVDPLGREVARTAGDKEVLVERFDLDFRVLPWNSLRDFGAAMAAKYAGRIRQDWHREEDMCLVTSLDPRLPVSEFLKREKLQTRNDHREENRAAEVRARGGPPRLA